MRAHVFGCAVLLCFLVAAAAAALDVVRCPVDCAKQADIGAAVQDCLLQHAHTNKPTVAVQLSGDVCLASTIRVPEVREIMYEGPATVVGSGVYIEPHLRVSVLFKDLVFDGKGANASLFASPEISANLTFIHTRLAGFFGRDVLHVVAAGYEVFVRMYSTRVECAAAPPSPPGTPPRAAIRLENVWDWKGDAGDSTHDCEIGISLAICPISVRGVSLNYENDILANAWPRQPACLADYRATPETPGFGMAVFETVKDALDGCSKDYIGVRYSPSFLENYQPDTHFESGDVKDEL